MNLSILVEDEQYLFWNLLLTLLMVAFIYINVRRSLRGAQGENSAAPSPVLSAAVKTLLFFVFYGISVIALLGDNKISWSGFVETLTGVYCNEYSLVMGKACDRYAALFTVLSDGAANLSLSALLANIMIGLYVFACYFYFNVQTGIAAMVLLLTSGYLGNGDYNFFAAFGLVSVGVAVGVGFYKIKTRLLNAQRRAFAEYRGFPLVRAFEFYLICFPYFAFSMALSAITLGYLFNVVVQAILLHFMAYWTLYRLYRAGHDIGLDYDPW